MTDQFLVRLVQSLYLTLKSIIWQSDVSLPVAFLCAWDSAGIRGNLMQSVVYPQKSDLTYDKIEIFKIIY